MVAVIASPLSMALAIATGVPPQHGLYTAIVAGAREKPLRVLVTAGWRDRKDTLVVRRDLKKAVAESREMIATKRG